MTETYDRERGPFNKEEVPFPILNPWLLVVVATWGGLSSAAYTRLPIPAGVATDAKVGSELIQVLALDADIGNNSLVFYSILAIHYFQALANVGRPACCSPGGLKESDASQ